MKLLTIFSAILFICFCTSTSSANIYSWVDENGITHFTNYSPPPAAKMVVKDIPILHRTVPEKESVEKGDLLGEGPEIEQDLEEDKIQAKRKKAEALEEEPYPSGSYSSSVTRKHGSRNSYVSKYPPDFHRYPPEMRLLKHHPNYHYKYHLDKPYAKKHHSAYGHKRDTTSRPYGIAILVSAISTTLAHIASAFSDGRLPRLKAVPMHIITLLAEVITGGPLLGLKAVLEDVALLLAAEAVLGDEDLVLAAKAVLVEAVGGDDCCPGETRFFLGQASSKINGRNGGQVTV